MINQSVNMSELAIDGYRLVQLEHMTMQGVIDINRAPVHTTINGVH
jgi:hypothetical protein